jgi:hypothetical protein
MNPAGTEKITAVAILIVVVLAGAGFCSDTLSFPATKYTIQNPDTGTEIGHSEYRADATADGATLHGANVFDDKQVDVETAHIEAAQAGQGPTLLDWDHTFYKADGSMLVRGYLDRGSGAATCISNNPGQKTNQSETISTPHDTWAGASVVVPIQGFLREGDMGKTRSLHVFTCAPTAKIYAVSVKIDPQAAVWPAYGAEALRVDIQPDFGVLNPIVESFVPKLQAWFDPNDGWAFVGDEAARWYKGPHVRLVKVREAANAGNAK